MARPGQILKNGRLELVILQTSATTGGALLEMEGRYGPGSRRPPAHFHPHQEETFKLVEGSMRFVIDGETRDVKAGEVVVLPPRTVHAIWNPTEASARVIWQTRPALRSEEFFETSFQLAGDDAPIKGLRKVLQLAAIASRYGAEFQLEKPVMRAVLPVLGAVARMMGFRASVPAQSP